MADQAASGVVGPIDGVPRVQNFPELFNPGQYHQEANPFGEDSAFGQESAFGGFVGQRPDGSIAGLPDSETSGGGGGVLSIPSVSQGGIGNAAIGTFQGAVVDPRRNAAARNEMERELIRQSVIGASGGNRGQTIYGPTPEAYNEANAAYANLIQGGLANSNQVISGGLDLLNQDLQSSIGSLYSLYGLGVDAVDTGFSSAQDLAGDRYNEARGEVRAGGYQARSDLESTYGSAIDRYDPISGIAPEAISAYKDRVLGDFSSSFADYQASPVYQFGLQEGMRGIENSAAARGMSMSGATLQNLSKFGSDYASRHFNDYYNTRVNQAKDLANFGASGIRAQSDLETALGGNLANVALNTSGSLSDLFTGEAAFRGGLYRDQANITSLLYQNQANQVADAYAKRSAAASPLYSQQATNTYDAGKSMAQSASSSVLGAGQRNIRLGTGVRI